MPRPRSLLPHTTPQSISLPVARAVARTGITPNGITALGLAGNLIAAWLAATGHWLPAGLAMLVSSALDLVDGALARYTGKVTRFGAIFDAVLDRYSEAAVLCGLLVYFEGRGDGVQIALIFVAVAGSIMVSLVRALAETFGMSLREGLFTRTERVVLLAGALIVGAWFAPAVTVALWILAVFSSLTALQRLYLVYQGQRAQSAAATSPPGERHDPSA